MNDLTHIMIVEDHEASRKNLETILTRAGYAVLSCGSVEECHSLLASTNPDLFVLDIQLTDGTGFDLATYIRSQNDHANNPILFMSSLDDVNSKLLAFDQGGVDYVTKPFLHQEILARIGMHLELSGLRQDLEQQVRTRTAELARAKAKIEAFNRDLEQENAALRERVELAVRKSPMIGSSKNMESIRERIAMVAPTHASVLILGDSGTGKELVAEAIHKASKRANAPFVKVNCASIPKTLFESEFFGHVKGAFTGAIGNREGRFAAADGGTLFLDEVGEIPIELQAKLLRVLQEKQYERVGEEQTRQVDVRILAATNQKLDEKVKQGEFREDLYYRLNVFPILVPPLRQRTEDIPELALHFVREICEEVNCPEPTLDDNCIQQLRSYSWPGNVRELRNVVEQGVIVSQGGILTVDAAIRSNGNRGESVYVASDQVLTESEVKELERNNIMRALSLCEGRIYGDKGAATMLGINGTTLASRMRKFDIRKSFVSNGEETDA